jgi:hypothetical protein
MWCFDRRVESVWMRWFMAACLRAGLGMGFWLSRLLSLLGVIGVVL